VFVSAYDSNTFARIAYRSADGKTLWQRQGGAGGLGIVAGAGANQNRIFIATARFTIAAYNASTGDRVWHARYGGGAGDISTALGIAPDGGRVYLTGQAPTAGNGTDFATVAFGAAGGSTRWVSRYNGPGDGRDVARALAVSPVGGSVYVAGASVGSGTESDFATVNYRS
jgi:outer membrane protein assembly factor BamB